MAKINLTGNELKSQREVMTRYTRYLPTLELKKLQLELERRKLEAQLEAVRRQLAALGEKMSVWQQLFAEKLPRPVEQMVHLKQVISGEANIAGLTVSVFNSVDIAVDEYDLVFTPPWIDAGIETIKEIIGCREWLKILEQQREAILAELRRTTQRINLFKDRLIPECKENIRQIRIHLGDMMAAAVGRAKIAKQKLQKK